VIHLAGFYYGAEPSQRPSGEPLRSYTQIEYDVARELRNPLFLFSPPRIASSMIAQTRAKRKEHCNLYTGALSKNAMKFTTHSRTTRTSHASSANWIYHLAARRAAWPICHISPSARFLKVGVTALIELRQRLTAGEGGAIGLTARQAVHGLGGVGKTRLAVVYAWHQASDYKDALLFVSARSPVDLRVNLAELCSPAVLNLPEWNQLEEIVRLTAVFCWLSEHSGWLLILDNADTPEAATEVEKTRRRT
jgi:hypothetical protein